MRKEGRGHEGSGGRVPEEVWRLHMGGEYGLRCRLSKHELSDLERHHVRDWPKVTWVRWS